MYNIFESRDSYRLSTALATNFVSRVLISSGFDITTAANIMEQEMLILSKYLVSLSLPFFFFFFFFVAEFFVFHAFVLSLCLYRCN